MVPRDKKIVLLNVRFDRLRKNGKYGLQVSSNRCKIGCEAKMWDWEGEGEVR